MEQEISKFTVRNHMIGMVGLREIFLSAKEFKGLSEIEMEKFLLGEAKRKNYIAYSVEGEYARALLKEFKKFLGERMEKDFSGLQVRILGPSCPSCQKLEQETMRALAELNLATDLDHVRDIKEITAYGVRRTPALVINGEIKVVGRIPTKKQIRKWPLEEISRK